MTTDETTPETEKPETHENVPRAGAEEPKRSRWGALASTALIVAAVAVLGYLIYSGITARVAASAKLAQTTEDAAVPTVRVVHPKTGAPTQELVLPGNEPLEDEFGVETGNRSGRKQSSRPKSDRGFECRKRTPAGAVAILRKGLRYF